MKDGGDRDSNLHHAMDRLDADTRHKGPGSVLPSIDFEEFAEFFEGKDISEEDARAFLETYWSLSLEYMSLGFGTHPVQLAKAALGQDRQSIDGPARSRAGRLPLTGRMISEYFEKAAQRNENGAEKESVNG